MEGKTNTADISVRAAFALVEGLILAVSLPLFYFVYPGYSREVSVVFLLAAISVLSLLTSLAMNGFLQFMYCGSVSFSKISIASLISPLTTFSLSLLAYFLPFLRGPIEQLFSESPQTNPEEVSLTKDIWGYAFYLFWGGVYGQTIGSGMISTCPK